MMKRHMVFVLMAAMVLNSGSGAVFAEAYDTAEEPTGYETVLTDVMAEAEEQVDFENPEAFTEITEETPDEYTAPSDCIISVESGFAAEDAEVYLPDDPAAEGEIIAESSPENQDPVLTVIPETAGDPEISENQEAEENPETEEDPEADSFICGYVRLEAGTAAYAAPGMPEADGIFAGETIVWAEVPEDEGPAASGWLRIWFDSELLRMDDSDVCCRFVPETSAVILTEEENEQVKAELAADGMVRQQNDILIPLADYQLRKEQTADEEAEETADASAETESRNKAVPEKTVSGSDTDAKTASSAITITKQPVSVEVEEREAASFRVSASGSSLTYQWQYQNSGSSTWANTGLEGNKTNTLQISSENVKSGFNGRKYRCVITDKNGNRKNSNAATLTVDILKFTAHPSGTTVNAGQTAHFSVQTDGRVYHAYQWQYRDSGDASWRNSGCSGSHTSALSVPNTSSGMNGRKFRCVITNSHGAQCVSNTAVLTVNSLAIISQPVSASIDAGKNHTFTVNARGNGLLYQWQWKAKGGSTWANTSISGATSNALRITNASTGFDGRQYRCVIKDSTGKQLVTNPVTLSVSPFAISRQPSNVSVAAGGNAAFSVGVTGNVRSWQWQWRAKNGTWANTSIAGATSSTLKLTNIQAAFSGREYRCIVTSRNGSQLTTRAAVLTVQTQGQFDPIIEQFKRILRGQSFDLSAYGVSNGRFWEISENIKNADSQDRYVYYYIDDFDRDGSSELLIGFNCSPRAGSVKMHTEYIPFYYSFLFKSINGNMKLIDSKDYYLGSFQIREGGILFDHTRSNGGEGDKQIYTTKVYNATHTRLLDTCEGTSYVHQDQLNRISSIYKPYIFNGTLYKVS